MIVLYVILGILVLLAVGVFCMRRMMNKVHTDREPDERRYEGGDKRALLLYQPTRHDTATQYAEQIAEGLHARGYDVTVNYASPALEYNLLDYELMVFGTGAYLNTAAVPVRRFLRDHPFARKQVILFSVGGNLNQDGEITQMEQYIGPENIVYKIKVSRDQEDVMADFLQRVELDDPDFDAIPEEEEEDEDEDEFSE